MLSVSHSKKFLFNLSSQIFSPMCFSRPNAVLAFILDYMAQFEFTSER